MKLQNTDKEVDFLHVGDRVRITSYSPFRGLRGTIRIVDSITVDPEEPIFCFYLVALEGAQIREPIWFEYFEVELLASASDMSVRSG
jgi:hypothetical protein